jgi:nucleosome binding factor SPN SPT16 subunit
MNEDQDLEQEELDEENEDEESNPELEAEFKSLVDSVGAQIDEHVKAASIELRKAIELSEKHGVPFRPNISFLSNTYMPVSFSNSKFAKLDNDVICEIADVWGEYIFEGGGWEHSAVC